MPSSTSSSDGDALAWARTLLVTVGPSVVVGAALLAVAALLVRGAPEPPGRDIESVLVDGQLARARAAPAADVLILGDSSALMGVDAAALGGALSARVESLAMIGYVGPAGYARALETYAVAGRPTPGVVLLMHPVSLAIDEHQYATLGFEQRALGPVGRQPQLESPRRDLFVRWLEPALDLPLPGAFGRRYGWPDDLGRALVDGHGSLVDPKEYTQDHAPAMRCTMTKAVEERLAAFARAVERLHPPFFAAGLTPFPSSTADGEAASTCADARDRFGRALAVTPLELPPAIPDTNFATHTHLSERGRAAFTGLVAAQLASVKR